MTRKTILLGWFAAVAGSAAGCASVDEAEMLEVQSSPLGTSCQVTGTFNPAYRAVDSTVCAFLRAQHVPNAQFALSKNGTSLVNRAYTCPGAIGVPTSTTTLFRLASNSKAWTSAALDVLIERGAISRSTRAFRYLGIVSPLPQGTKVDSRVFGITVGNLIDHQSGWDDNVSSFDPTHRMRDIALALNMKQPINAKQMVQYMLGQPLQEAPGTTYAYCNFCYDVLGMIVEKASGMSFLDYLRQVVAMPIGVSNLAISPTLEPRLPTEVARYFSPNTGLSAVNVTSGALVPGPNGGDGLIREVGAPAAGLATSAASMLKLMDHYLIWGVGPAPGAGYTWARSGSDEGTSTWAEQRADLKRWAFVINTRAFATPTAFDDFTVQMDQLLDSLP
jgi:CubicO group peptidase (beta-lactamase class C family)